MSQTEGGGAESGPPRKFGNTMSKMMKPGENITGPKISQFLATSFAMTSSQAILAVARDFFGLWT